MKQQQVQQVQANPPFCGSCGAPAQQACAVLQEQERQTDGSVFGVCTVCCGVIRIGEKYPLFAPALSALEPVPRKIAMLRQQVEAQRGGIARA